jgi:hypothetical protein
MKSAHAATVQWHKDHSEGLQDELGQIIIRESYGTLKIEVGIIYEKVKSNSSDFMEKVFGFKKTDNFNSWKQFILHSLPTFQRIFGLGFSLPKPIQNYRKDYHGVMHPSYLWKDGHVPTFRHGSFLFGPAEKKIFFVSLTEYNLPFYYQDATGQIHGHQNFNPNIL